MQKITPCLWFDGQAEEAMNFYLSVFKNGKVRDVMRYGDTGPGPKGSVLTATLEIEGQEFIALNGGSMYHFTPALSLFVRCETQEEVDRYWDALLVGGQAVQCGWLTDQFGVSWQIVPTVLGEMLKDPDAAKSARVMQAMMQMVKLDIAGLKRAYEQG